MSREKQRGVAAFEHARGVRAERDEQPELRALVLLAVGALERMNWGCGPNGYSTIAVGAASAG